MNISDNIAERANEPPQGVTGVVPGRDELERLKLQAEVDEIRARANAPKPGLFRRWGARTTAWLAIVIPLGLAIVGGIIQWAEFREQQERLAKFQVSSEILALSDQLNSGTIPARVQVAHQLSWFGRPAAFLMLEKLAREKEPAVQRALILSLAEIDRNADTGPGVLSLMVETTQDFLRLTLDDAPSLAGVTLLGRRLSVTAALAGVLVDDAMLAAERDAILARVTAMRVVIEDQADGTLHGNKQQLLDDIATLESVLRR